MMTMMMNTIIIIILFGIPDYCHPVGTQIRLLVGMFIVAASVTVVAAAWAAARAAACSSQGCAP